MVLPLYVVSLLLVAGGGAAALYGADTIRTETGATLAVAGVAMACAGLLLFALTACLGELRRIRRSIEAGEGVAAQSPFPVAVPPAAPAVIAPAAAAAAAVAAAAAETVPPVPSPAPAPPPLPPVPVVVPEPEPRVAMADIAPAVRETERILGRSDEADGFGWDPERPAHDPGPGTPEEPGHGEPEPDHPRSGPADRHAAEPAPHAGPEPVSPTEIDAEAATEAEAETETDAEPQAVAADREPELEPPAAEPAVETLVLETPAERKLVATYTSGENTYFMYSDNAIEAETPHGRFRFASMDELRVFVETGAGGMPLSPAAPPGA